jgi:hypothetical protein
MQTASARCPEKDSLEENIRLAMNQVIELNNREMQAVITGDFEALPNIKRDVIEARKWKDALLDSYHSHIRGHGC